MPSARSTKKRKLEKVVSSINSSESESEVVQMKKQVNVKMEQAKGSSEESEEESENDEDEKPKEAQNSSESEQEKEVAGSSESEEEQSKNEVVEDSESDYEDEREDVKKQDNSSDSSEDEEVTQKKVSKKAPVKVKVMMSFKKQPEEVEELKKEMKPETMEPRSKKPKLEQSALSKEQGIQQNAIQFVLQSFTKEQLVELVSKASVEYKGLYKYFKAAAGSDVAHRKVFLRGLAPQTTTQTLKDKYKSFGKIEDAAVNFDEFGNSLGHGFVIFSDIEAPQRCFKMSSRVTIDGFKPSCHLMTGQNQLITPPSVENPVVLKKHLQKRVDAEASRKIFVGGLSRKTTSDTLQQYFKRFGDVESVHVPTHPDTNLSKCFGFVIFREDAAAKLALQVPTKTIDGREAACTPFMERSNPDIPVRSTIGPQGPKPRERFPKSQQVFVTRLSPNSTEDTLRQTFAKFGEVIEAFIATHHNTGISKSYGFVTFSDETAVKKALQASRINIDGQDIVCIPKKNSKRNGGSAKTNGSVELGSITPK